MTTLNNAKKINSLNFCFTGFWVSAIIGVLIFSAGIALLVAIRAEQIAAGMLTTIRVAIPAGTIIAMVFACVFGSILLYKLWKLIPSDVARTSPSKAVGLCFIPFFGFYWIFVAFWGLGQDMNKTLREREIQYQINEALGLIFCILACVGIIPRHDFFMTSLFLASQLLASIVVIFFLKSVKNGAICLLESESDSFSVTD